MKPGSLLVLGGALGLLLGLLVAWVIFPTQYYDTYPPLLQPAYRQDWIRMTALTYGQEGNWERTQVRLGELPPTEIRQVVAKTLTDAVEAGAPIGVLQRIAQLARHYGVNNVTVQTYTRDVPPAVTPRPTSTPPARTPTSTPTPAGGGIIISTPTPLPPTPTLPPSPSPFTVISQTLTCATHPQIGVSLQVSATVLSARGRPQVQISPLPGVQVWLLGQESADRAITGFKPALGSGYADFIVSPGETYTLYIDVPTGAPVATLQIGPCTEDEGGGWLAHTLTLQRESPGE